MHRYWILSLVVLAAAAAAWLLLREPAPPETTLDTTRGPPHGTDGDDGQGVGILQPRPLPPADPTEVPPPGAGRLEPAFAGVRGEVVDERDRPLAGARVWLETFDPFTLRGGRTGPGERISGQARTASDGTFEIPLSEVRWVRVVAALEGYATVGSPVPGPGSHARLKLPLGGSVAVRVTATKGRPVSGAAIVVQARDVLLEAEADEKGRAQVDGVAPGRIDVRARANGFGESATGPLGLLAGETLEVSVVLPAAVALRGRVVDAANGDGVGDAEVHVRLRGRTVDVGRTDGDGRFGPVAVAAAGERTFVAVRADGYAPVLWLVHLQATDGGHEVEVPLAPADPWRGRVVDGRGTAVAGARLSYTPDGIHGRPSPTATTDEAGRFALSPPPPPVPGRRVVLVAEAAAGRAALSLRPGDVPPDDLVLVLRRGAIVTGRVLDAARVGGVPDLTIRLDPVWREIPDRMRPGPETSHLQALGERGRLSLTTTTDDAGWWRLAGVPDGRYLVRVLAPRATVFGEEPFDVRGADANAGTIRLGGGHPLIGRAIDDTGRALAGAEITASTTTPSRRAWRQTSDADGRWRFEDLPAGTYLLRATFPGRRWTSLPDVALPRDEALDLVLPAGGRLTGRLHLEQGPYRGEFTLTLTPAGQAPRSRGLHRTLATTDGAFVLEGLTERAWQVRVETPDGHLGQSPRPVEVRPGTSSDVRIDLRAASTLRGVLRTTDGAKVARGEIRLRYADTGHTQNATVGIGGRYHLTGLASGTWTISARGRGGAPIEDTVALAAGTNVEHDLVLAPGGALVTTVVGADGQPRAGALVMAVAAGAASGSGPSYRAPPRTGADGRVRLEDLPAGPVLVRVRTPSGERGQAEVTVEAGDATNVTVAVRAGAR